MRKRTLLLIPLALLLAGCSPQVQYLWQSANGQFSLLNTAKPIPEVIADPSTPAEIRQKLELVQRVRAFATGELGLPDHGSYRKYTDLGRPYVVWNVFSAPEFSTHLRTTCFPVVGCVSYQGFFAEADAQRLGQQRRDAGDDVLVGGISAYSTLGYFKDPLLSSMLSYSEPNLIRTIIHELSHPSLYVAGDTVFNESYAMSIENEGMRRWLAEYGTPELAAQDAAEQQQQKEWESLLLASRAELQQVYDQPISDAEKRVQKAKILDDLQAKLTEKLRAWRSDPNVTAQRPNNASLGAVAAYADLVPDFEQLLRRVGGDIPKFIEAARACSKKPKTERAACLRGEP